MLPLILKPISSFWMAFKFKLNSKPSLSVLPTFLIKLSVSAWPGGKLTLDNKSVVSLLKISKLPVISLY